MKTFGTISFILATIIVLVGAFFLFLPIVVFGIAWLIVGTVAFGAVEGRRQIAANLAQAAADKEEAEREPTHTIQIDVINAKTGEVTSGVHFE